jgi:hypothetical protein
MNLANMRKDWIYMCRVCKKKFSIDLGWRTHSKNTGHAYGDIVSLRTGKHIKTLGITGPDRVDHANEISPIGSDEEMAPIIDLDEEEK